MAIRLNAFIRNQILSAVMQHGFAARERALDDEKRAIGEAVYNDVYPEEVQAQMSALPPDYLPSSSDLRVQFQGYGFNRVYFGKSRPIAERHTYNAAVVYDQDHPLHARYHKWTNAQDSFIEQRNSARAEAEAVLRSVTTLEKLIKVWPEVETFAKPFFVVSASTAVAVPIKQLNAALGLPPKSKTTEKNQ